MLEKVPWSMKQLQAFVLVAEHRSFKRAAEEMFRSQSAISALVSQLESALDMTLFERTSRKVKLTAEGEELFVYVKRGFAEFAGGLSNAKRVAERKSERIRVACVPAAVLRVVPKVLNDFAEQRPDVEVCIIEHMLDDVTRSVIEHQAHFGVGPPVRSADCDVDVVLEEAMFAVFALGTFPEDTTSIALFDLLDYPLFRPTQVSPEALLFFERAARRSGKPLVAGHQISQAQSMVNMAAAGHGVGVIPRSILDALEPRKVQSLRIVDPAASRSMAIIQRRNIAQTQPVRELIATFKEVMRSIGHQGAVSKVDTEAFVRDAGEH